MQYVRSATSDRETIQPDHTSRDTYIDSSLLTESRQRNEDVSKPEDNDSFSFEQFDNSASKTDPECDSEVHDKSPGSAFHQYQSNEMESGRGS